MLTRNHFLKNLLIDVSGFKELSNYSSIKHFLKH